MTISSLAKIIVGVNRMVVENVEIEYPEVTIHGIIGHRAIHLFGTVNSNSVEKTKK